MTDHEKLKLIKKTSKLTGYKFKYLKNKNRKRGLAYHRFATINLLTKHTCFIQEEIAEMLNYSNHSSIIYANKMVRNAKKGYNNKLLKIITEYEDNYKELLIKTLS